MEDELVKESVNRQDISVIVYQHHLKSKRVFLPALKSFYNEVIN